MSQERGKKIKNSLLLSHARGCASSGARVDSRKVVKLAMLVDHFGGGRVVGVVRVGNGERVRRIFRK